MPHGIHHRRHEQYFFCIGMIAAFLQLTSPAKQLLRRKSMPSDDRTDRSTARYDLRNDPRLSSSLHFRQRPAPVKTSSGRTGFVIAVCAVSIVRLTIRTEPQARRSPVIRKMAAEQRLPSTGPRPQKRGLGFAMVSPASARDQEHYIAHVNPLTAEYAVVKLAGMNLVPGMPPEVFVSTQDRAVASSHDETFHRPDELRVRER